MIVIYSNFAYFYDRLMRDVDYPAWADYIERLFALHGGKPSLVLDLGCGTGSFCEEMAARGYDMIGIDRSSDMLACARAKSAGSGAEILYLQQDMTGFELYGTVDAVVCLMDSINYLTKDKQVQKVFRLVRNYLNPGGLFVFDINSAYKLRHTLGNQVFYSIEEEISYIWQNSYNPKSGVCRFDLTFFAREGELYARFDEEHRERAYSIPQIKKMLKQADLELCAVYGAFGFKQPASRCERIFFVCRRSEDRG